MVPASAEIPFRHCRPCSHRIEIDLTDAGNIAGGASGSPGTAKPGLVLAAPPAMADRPVRTPARTRALIGECIAEHRAGHADRCVGTIGPDAAARRAFRDHRRDRRDGLARERECREDPPAVSPRALPGGPAAGPGHTALTPSSEPAMPGPSSMGCPTAVHSAALKRRILPAGANRRWARH